MSVREHKRKVFSELYDKGATVMVVFDFRVGDAVVPDVARKMSRDGKHLALKFARSYSLPRFEVTDEGIQAVLSFKGSGRLTFIPWISVAAIGIEGSSDFHAWEPGDDGIVSHDPELEGIGPYAGWPDAALRELAADPKAREGMTTEENDAFQVELVRRGFLGAPVIRRPFDATLPDMPDLSKWTPVQVADA